MWLKEYLHRRWGLFALVGGVTALALWTFGGGSKAPKKAPPKGTPKGKAALKAAPPKVQSAKSTIAACVRAGIRADSPPQPTAAAVKHPGFPRAVAKPPRMGKAAQGLFPLRKKVAQMPALRLAHAKLVHRLAKGFTQRFHYYAYLSQNRRALRRWHRKQQERKRRRAGASAPTRGGAAKVPPAMLLLTRAKGYRNNALGYYKQLTTLKQFEGYAKRAAALLEYASLLMIPAPRTIARRPQPKGKKKKARARKRGVSAAGIALLHRLIKEHPSAPETIEALGFLVARAVARKQCPKVIFLLKGLPSAPLPRATPSRLALLRSYGHYHAGRCLLAKGTGEAATRRLLRAVVDANVATIGGAKHGAVIVREASILLGRAAASAGDPAKTRKLLAAVGPTSAPVVTAVLVAQLAKEGLFKQAVALCPEPGPRPSAGPSEKPTMKFEYRHTFDVSVDKLVDAMFHPDLPAHLTEKMTTIISIEVLERDDDDATIKRRVKYKPVPMIKRIGTKKVTPEAMEWVEESTYDRSRKVQTFANVPTHPKIRAKMTNSGRIEFLARGADRCERIMSGELKVKFPILGRIAEGMISKNAKKILDEEAIAVAAWLKDH